jgi:glycine cleavage system pyridoxal-binding protein P
MPPIALDRDGHIFEPPSRAECRGSRMQWRALAGFDSLEALDRRHGAREHPDGEGAESARAAKGEHEALHELREIGKKNKVFRSFIGTWGIMELSRRR